MHGVNSTYGVAGAINKATCNNTTRNVKQHEHQILDNPTTSKTSGYSMMMTEPSHQTLVLSLNPLLNHIH